MKTKVIITVIAIALIIGLAIFTGVKISKGDSKSTNTNPVTQNTSSPLADEKTPDINKETPTPEATITPTLVTKPTPTPTPSNTGSKDVTKLSSQEKEKYAKDIAKENWEKLGVNKKVYYSYDSINPNGKYLIAVREESTTKALVWYEIDINDRTCNTVN